MADATPPESSSLPNDMDWREFLADYPPGTRAKVEGSLEASTNNRPKFSTPELQLYCDTGGCEGPSWCKGVARTVGLLFPAPQHSEVWDGLLVYTCKRCNRELKTYAVRFLGSLCFPDEHLSEFAKMGEWPPFSFRTPSKVISLVGPDKELFLRGRKAEAGGLGIGAFAYYRRIIEDQKNRLLGEIVKVARRTNAPAVTITQLEDAISETQFSKAMDMVKDAVPQSLFIEGQNPLTLLHRALSRNLHGASDEECLKVAHNVRVILFEFAERLSQALRDQKELEESVNRLLNP